VKDERLNCHAFTLQDVGEVHERYCYGFALIAHAGIWDRSTQKYKTDIPELKVGLVTTLRSCLGAKNKHYIQGGYTPQDASSAYSTL